jgi:hypothetical protein
VKPQFDFDERPFIVIWETKPLRPVIWLASIAGFVHSRCAAHWN